MWKLILWLYLANAILLIIHELDSVYWREWELFHLPGGINGFLLMHVPMLFIIFIGFLKIEQQEEIGLTYSFVLSLAGLFGFGIHYWFKWIGKPGFDTWISITILWLLLLISGFQLIVTVMMF